MAHLSLSLLGPFQVALDGQPVTAFKSNKVRALLAYLAVEADRPHRREVLAGLLWPDWPDRDAMSSLRYTLSDLRKAIGDREAEPPYLLISREALQFNRASDHWLDVAAFTELLAGDRGDPQITEQLAEAVGLVQGDFLEGFTVGDSPVFEEWVLLTRERLARRVSSTLHELAAIHERRGEYAQAQAWAWRQLELEPWDETAHQALMRALALAGQRSAALAQYQSCRRVLAEELGVEPGEETTRLYQQIRDGKLKVLGPSRVSPPELAVELPPFLEEEPSEVQRPVFVAREWELGQLDQHLALALAGRGRVVFVTGEAGSGKTALLQEFSRRAQEAHVHLVVASGNCNAYTGIGDPYLPFREIVELLTGDVEARWAAGAMTRDHARRLWHMLPYAAQSLIDTGPDLIDTFIPQSALLGRATTYGQWPERADWLARLDQRVAPPPITGPGAHSPQQSDLFEQYTRVLQALARHVPLVLMLDDLQWADLGSISLLFHLGRHLAGSRLLIVGAYRPEEVALGRNGDRHPLEAVANEFQRDFGDIIVDLGQAEGWAFIDAILDTEPNRLGIAFREMLYRQTNGHPLFTVELLRGMQERGDLVQGPEGRWVEATALDWETLPARVEAVIAERIARLVEPLRAALRVASVEGELFTAEVVARVAATPEREMLSRLSRELDRKHRLVHVQAIERLGTQRVSRYRFRHYLCQKYLYESLDEGERTYLHEDVGSVLEDLYGERASEISTRLARHFQEAGITDKAVRYLLQAGQRALQLYAYQEAIGHLSRGLALLVDLPDSPERAQQELSLHLALGIALTCTIGFPSPAVLQAYTRAGALSQQLGDTFQLCRVMGEISLYHYVLAEHKRAQELGEAALDLAEQVNDPQLVAIAHCYLGIVLFSQGQYLAARTHLEQVIAFYDPQKHHRSIVQLRGSDVGLSALAYLAASLSCLGYPDEARKPSQKALALAREFDHSFTLADVLDYGCCLVNKLRWDAQALKDDATELVQVARERLDGLWLEAGLRYRGEALAMEGQLQEGIAQMQNGLAHSQSAGLRCHVLGTQISLGEAYARAGDLERGLATLEHAQVELQRSNERHWESELLRVRAELLRMQGCDSEAEASLQQAIEVARHQHARSWELRATVSLCRLWQDQGKADLARQTLADIYGWFTEGFETADLIEARTLLGALSG